MKNVHLILAGESYLSLNCSYRDSAIGTEVGKPYWTYSKDWKHHMSVTDASVRPHNIYITNDEEIKVGDWYILHLEDRIVKRHKQLDLRGITPEFSKKIILTTDQDLIEDSVQAIEDDFLEWFIKNPSCEEVEISTYHIKGDISGKLYYKIIIPKEEHYKGTLSGFEEGPNAHSDFLEQNSNQTKQEKIDDYAIEFAEWLLYQDITQRGKSNFVCAGGVQRSTKELLEIFKNK